MYMFFQIVFIIIGFLVLLSVLSNLFNFFKGKK